jgi:hypothetical protein
MVSGLGASNIIPYDNGECKRLFFRFGGMDDHLRKRNIDAFRIENCFDFCA